MKSASTRARRSGLVRSAIVVLAIALVAIAPFAADQQRPAGAVAIGGAASINDRLALRFPGAGAGPTTDIHVLGFNDFHGTLEPGSQTLYGKYAGGAAFMAKVLKDRQTAYAPRVATVMAGDHIGASPLNSALFFDEPAVIAANHMGLDFASVGNHEFDKGKDELLRMQSGGCKVPEGCTAAPYALPGGGTTPTYPGANWQYLSANVINDATTNPLLPAYGTKTFTNGSGGTTKIGFIGLVLKETPTIVTPSGVAGLTFTDETVAANAAATALKAAGAQTIVMVIHQGGFQSPGAGATNSCNGNLAGSPIVSIVNNGLDPAIGVIVSGHTHAEYRCTLSLAGTNRLITSAASFGRVVTDITLTVDDVTGELTSATANNILVENSTNPNTASARVPDPTKADPAVQAIVSQYSAAASPLANAIKGAITADITRTANGFGESSLGDVIADAQLAATAPGGKGGSLIAFMNPGGIRQDFLFLQSAGGEANGLMTYGEIFTVQPFGNTLVVKTLTGAQIRSVLEQQFVGCGGQTTQRILQISNGFKYEQDSSAATCSGKIGKIWLNNVVLDPSASFRVTMNSFLATGGDGFTVFNQGTAQLGGDVDVDAMTAYFDTNHDGQFNNTPGDAIADDSALAPGPQNRIVAITPDPVVPESHFPALLAASGLIVAIAAVALVALRSRRTL